MSSTDENVLRGTIHILVDNSDPLNKVFKPLYPKTVADQIENLDDAIESKIQEIPIASSSTFGLTKIGNNISCIDGIVSLTSENIISALGFTPVTATDKINSANTADKLASTVNIDGFSFNGTNDVNHYAACTTASDVPIKTVSIANFNLKYGALIVIKFVNANSANSIALNVNNTGAKQIKYHGEIIDPRYIKANSIYTFLFNGESFDLIGDIHADTNAVTGVRGSSEDDYHTGNVTITPESIGLGNVNNVADNLKNVLSAQHLTTGRTIDGVDFDGSENIVHYGQCNTQSDVPVKSVSCKNFVLQPGSIITVTFNNNNIANGLALDVNNTGAKTIKYRNANIDPTVLNAGRTYTFVYDGTNYQFIGDINTNVNLVTGVKGSNDPNFQTGNVIITKSSLGIDKVENTADNEKQVLSANKLATARTISLTNGATGAANFDGSDDLIINVTSLNADQLTGTAAIDITGTASKADKLSEAKTISLENGATGFASFDGSENVTIDVTALDASKLTGTADINITGTAGQANKLTNKRTITITDGIHYSESTEFDGSENITLKLPETINTTFAGVIDEAQSAIKDANGNVIDETYAALNSPALTGEPTAPTPDLNDISNKIATTEFVSRASSSLHYCHCNTESDITVKEVTCEGFILKTGASIIVTFDKDNTTIKPSLKINDLNAAPIMYRGSNIAYNYLQAGRTYHFIYDGTNYQLVGDLDTNLVTGVKGVAESEYRRNNVSISATDIGLNLVNNTADADKIVAEAIKATQDSAGNVINTTYVKKVDKIDTASLADVATKAEQDINGKAITTTYAKLESPVFTGEPLAPTAAVGTNTKQIATTEFVKNEIDLVKNTTSDLNSEINTITNNLNTLESNINTSLTSKQAKSDALTSISGLTTTENKMIYTTAANTYDTTDLTNFARTILDDANATEIRTTIQALGKDETAVKAESDANGNNIATTYAPINNANLTGIPTAPTATAGSNTQQVANTAYVKSEIDRLIAADSDLLETIETLKNNLESEQGNIFDVLNGKQDKHAALTSISGLSTAGNEMIYTTAENTYTTTHITPFTLTVLNNADAVTFRNTIDALGKTEDAVNAKKLGGINASDYALKANSTLTGIPTAPTAVEGTSTTQIATTEFVVNEVAKLNTANNNLSTAINTIKTNLETADSALDTKISNKQDKHAALTSISGLTTTADKMIYTTAENTYKTTDLTEFARSVLDDSTSAEVRTTIGALGKDEKAKDSEKADLATKAEQDVNGAIISTTYAKINNPIFTGVPQAPNPAEGTANTQIATTAFVQIGIDKLTAANAELLAQITSLEELMGEDTADLLTAIDGKQNKHAALTSISGLTTAADKMIYTTAENVYTTTDLTEIARSILSSANASAVRTVINALGKDEDAENAKKLGGINASDYALKADSKLSGTPTAPTAAAGTNTTQIATTEFVNTAVTTALNALVGNASSELDTLEKIANAVKTNKEAINEKQDKHISLTSIAGLSAAKDKLLYTTALDTYSSTDLTDFARTILDDVDAETVRTTINALGKDEDAENAKKLGGINASDYALKADSNLSGTPTAPTADPGTNTTQIATTEFVANAIANLVGSAPDVLNTFEEIATAINNDDNLYVTLTNLISDKQDKNAALTSISGLSTAADKMIYTTAANTYATTDLTSFARSILAGTDASAIREIIGALSSDGTIAKATADSNGNNIIETYATKISPEFSGTPTAPTATAGTNNTQIATTAFVNTAIANNHYNTSIVVGDETATVNTAVNEGNIYLKLFDNTINRSNVQLHAGNNVSLSSDADGVITINSHDTTYETATTSTDGLMSAADKNKLTNIEANANNYSLPRATADELGGIKTGDNITNTNGTISVTSANIINALGFTPANNNINVNNVQQTVTTDNNSYPLLATGTNDKTQSSADTTLFSAQVKLNPAQNSITATTFIGNLSGTATQATMDSNGNNIADTYAPLNSPSFSGTPTAPTAGTGTNTTQIATTEFVTTAVNNVLGENVPDKYDTLAKIATALTSSTDTTTGMAAALDGKQPISNILTNLSGLSTAKNQILYTTAKDTFTTAPISDFVVSLLDDANETTFRASIGALSTGDTAYDSSQLGGYSAGVYAKLASPKFTGTPSAPTASAGTNTDQIATTAFVQTAATNANTHYTTKLIVGGSSATANTAVTNGNVYLRLFDDSTNRNNIQLQAGTGITIGSDSTGVITITNSSTNTDTKVSFTSDTSSTTYPLLFKNSTGTTTTAAGTKFNTGIYATPSTSSITATTFIGALSGTASNANSLGGTAAANYAKLASPTFTGTPTAPTATAETNTDQIATTAFVRTAISNLVNSAPEALDTLGEIATVLGDTSDLSGTLINAISSKQNAHAALSSIAGLTTSANKMIYTTAANTYTTTDLTATGISLVGASNAAAARTAIGAISAGGSISTAENANKLGGTSAANYALLASPSFTGTPTAPTATYTSNDTTIATTAFVKTATAAANTHYTTKLIVGGSTATANAAVTSGNVYLRLFDDSTHRNNVQLKAGTGITVGSDSTGVITITNSSTNTDTKVTQNKSTTNATYPILLTPTADATANVSANNAIFGSGVKVNPSTSAITATTFIGTLSGTATNANQLGGTTAANYALLASPNFSGTPTAPTATTGTNTTQIATTEFVQTAINNGHYTTKLIVGGSTATANAAVTSGNVYLRLFDDSNHRNNVQLKAGTGISVSSDSAGVITITNSDTNTDTKVTQNKSTTNSTYPILLTPTANATANVSATNAIFGSGVKVNPSTSAVTATTFIGALSGTATNANQLGGTAAASYALLASPSFSGTPTAPTATSSTSNTQIATTAFVHTVAEAANTHYTTKLIVGGSTATANAAVTSGNIYLRLFDDSTHRNNVQLQAGTGISISSSSTGVITITNSSTNTDTKVTQNKSTTNSTYPILLTPTANATANVSATNAIFGSGVKVNPSTSAITATTFIGALSGTATNATNLAGESAAMYLMKPTPFTATISSSAWNSYTDPNGVYNYSTTISNSNLHNVDVIHVIINRESQVTASKAKICPTNESGEGTLTLYSQDKPESSIKITYFSVPLQYAPT